MNIHSSFSPSFSLTSLLSTLCPFFIPFLQSCLSFQNEKKIIIILLTFWFTGVLYFSITIWEVRFYPSWMILSINNNTDYLLIDPFGIGGWGWWEARGMCLKLQQPANRFWKISLIYFFLGYLGAEVGSSVNLRLVQNLSFSHSQPTASGFWYPEVISWHWSRKEFGVTGNCLGIELVKLMEEIKVLWFFYISKVSILKGLWSDFIF